LGTLLAVMIYFRKTILDLFTSLFHWKNPIDHPQHRYNRLLILYLGIATLMTGLFYMLFQDGLDALFANMKPGLVAVMLIITGSLLYISDLMRGNGIPANNMGWVRSVIIGLAQGIAIIPGISRSGTTIAVSLFTGIKRKDAAQFSFLLSIPAILGANVSVFKELSSLKASQFFVYLAGFLAAAVSGYAVISILIGLIRRNKLKYFAYYCWALAVTVFIILVI
ncbi:MAG TPA: undecaprenyl-diphosphate phosphatase, partial [Candidatus Cloacimonadota bacterium]|nr:undecaprenyl-diphosphate phosphatase [Candidatus Cloacimonadota bacterium]